jgi:hypothetical protein
MERVNLALGRTALDEGRGEKALARLKVATARWQAQGGAAWAMTLVVRRQRRVNEHGSPKDSSVHGMF